MIACSIALVIWAGGLSFLDHKAKKTRGIMEREVMVTGDEKAYVE